MLHLLLTCKVGKFTKKKKKENGREGAYFARYDLNWVNRVVSVSLCNIRPMLSIEKQPKKFLLCFTLWNDQQLPWVYFVWRPIFIPHTHTFDLYLFFPLKIVLFSKEKNCRLLLFQTFLKIKFPTQKKNKFKFHILTSHKLNFIQLAPKLNSK